MCAGTGFASVEYVKARIHRNVPNPTPNQTSDGASRAHKRVKHRKTPHMDPSQRHLTEGTYYYQLPRNGLSRQAY